MATFKVVLCLALLRTFTQVIAEDCLLYYKNTCITAHLEEVTYMSAEANCMLEDGLLVIIDSWEKEYRILRSLSTKGIEGPFWIGISDRITEGKWLYSNGSELGDYTNWASSEPNNFRYLDEDCVHLMDNGQWNDRVCTRELKFICEIPRGSCNIAHLSVPNGFFQGCLTSTIVSHASDVSFHCYDGYEATDNHAICTDGIWTAGSCIPACKAPEIPNGMILLSPKEKYSLEEEAQFICEKGFFLKKNQPQLSNSLKCSGINQWSSDHLPCVSSEHFLMSNPGDLLESTTLDLIDQDSFLLNCSSMQYELDEPLNYKFSWTKDGDDLKTVDRSAVSYSINEDGQLELFSITKHTAGTYICIKQIISTNEVKEIVVYKLRHISKACPTDTVYASVNVHENELTILRCHNFRQHETSFRWLKYDKEIRYDKDHRIFLPDGGLLLKRISHDDSGNYTCAVTDISSSCVSIETYELSVKPTVNSVCGKTFNDNIDLSPWFVSLWWDDEEKPFCYGVLVSDQWIVSAASCLANIRRRLHPNIFIQFGFNENFTLGESPHLYSVNSIIIHSKYSKRLLVNDIGLVKLSTPLPLNGKTEILCLMSKELQNIFTYQRECDPPKSIIGNVPGMGPLESREHTPNTELMFVTPNEQCGHHVDLSSSESMFCAELVDKNFSTFAGDIGSPFVVEINERFYLYGIYSWGERISHVGKFDYFTKVSRFYDWIMSHIK